MIAEPWPERHERDPEAEAITDTRRRMLILASAFLGAILFVSP